MVHRWILVLLPFTVLSCHLTKLEHAEVHHGIEIPAGSQVRMNIEPNEHLLAIARVFEPITVAGIDFPADTWLEFSPDGKLMSAQVSKLVRVRNVLFDEGAEILFHEDTTQLIQASLIQDTRFNDGICLTAGSEVFFRASGEVNYAVIQQLHVLHGEAVPGQMMVHFTSNGEIRRVTPLRKD